MKYFDIFYVCIFGRPAQYLVGRVVFFFPAIRGSGKKNTGKN